ncbi:DUF84 family protein [Peribacillus saganii]|uniref:Probable inosine/xanthosine triphosphatase n=1 Tax=Peribacillus saganii TaxID=2303992 RepID=A0A372LNV8_9BACI|nr:DUF84 family protein [Peribacillus saganii]RFU68758.1 DUF84 family protein [Peribacillus saganii]
MKIAIGSKNPAKVNAVKAAFGQVSGIFLEVDAESGVSNQPFSDEETIKGAINRARNSQVSAFADIGIGLEGGVVETAFGLFLCNWGALVTQSGKTFVSGGARIPLPPEVAEMLRAGRELGPVMSEYTQKNDVPKREGAIGVFTNERITRSEMFRHIVQMLIGQCEYHKRFLNGD